MRLRSLSTLIFSIGLLGLLAPPAGAASFSPSATFKLSSTVVKARLRSWTIQHRYCPSSSPNGVNNIAAAETTPVSRR